MASPPVLPEASPLNVAALAFLSFFSFGLLLHQLVYAQ